MSPAGDFDDASRAVEIVITWIGVGLQMTAKVFQHRFGMFSAPVGGECEPDGGFCQPAMRTIINGMDPQPRGLRFAIAGIEHGYGRIVGVEL